MWRYYLTNRTSGDMLAREYPRCLRAPISRISSIEPG